MGSCSDGETCCLHLEAHFGASLHGATTSIVHLEVSSILSIEMFRIQVEGLRTEGVVCRAGCEAP